MLPSFTAPPAPHSFFNRVASSSSSASARGRPEMTDTPLPPRPATSRPTRTGALPRAAGAGGVEPGRLAADGRPAERCAASWSTTPRKVCLVLTPTVLLGFGRVTIQPRAAGRSVPAMLEALRILPWLKRPMRSRGGRGGHGDCSTQARAARRGRQRQHSSLGTRTGGIA